MMVAKRFFVIAMHNRNLFLYLCFSILFFAHLCMGEIKGDIGSDSAKSKTSSENKKSSAVRSKATKTLKDTLKLKDYPKSLERNALFRAGDKINIRYATLESASKKISSRRTIEQRVNASSTNRSLKNSDAQKSKEIPAWLAKLNKKENKPKQDKQNSPAKGIKFISYIINQHNTEIQDCYHDYLKISPDVRGRMVVRIFVNSEGHVEKVTIKESDIQDEIFKDKIVEIIKRWDDLGQGTLANKIYLQEYVFGD